MKKKPLYLVIIGPSGGGKGTQAKLLAQRFGLKHLSMGALFREFISQKSKRAKEVARKVNSGQWVDTSTTLLILKPVLEKNLSSGFILDGFPRLPDQPRSLDSLLIKSGIRLDLVIHLQVSEDEIMIRRKRLVKKGKSFYPGQKRKDESSEAIKSRLLSYQKTIRPILAYYRQKGILKEVDGGREVEPIHREILRLIAKKVKK